MVKPLDKMSKNELIKESFRLEGYVKELQEDNTRLLNKEEACATAIREKLTLERDMRTLKMKLSDREEIISNMAQIIRDLV